MSKSRVSHHHVVIQFLSQTNIFCDEAAIVFQAASQRCFVLDIMFSRVLTECVTAKLVLSKVCDDDRRVAMKAARVTEEAGCRCQVFQIDVGEESVYMMASMRCEGKIK